MQSDKSPEQTRQEAIKSWRRRRQQDAELRLSYYDLEVVLRRLGSKIKEHNSQRTVITRLHKGQEVVIDRSVRNISLEKRSFFVFSKRRVISFSLVASVVTDYRYKRIHIRDNGDEWQVSLGTNDSGVRNIKIDRSNEEQYTYDLAEAISQLIGKEIKENSTKPDPLHLEPVFEAGNMPGDLNL